MYTCYGRIAEIWTARTNVRYGEACYGMIAGSPTVRLARLISSLDELYTLDISIVQPDNKRSHGLPLRRILFQTTHDVTQLLGSSSVEDPLQQYRVWPKTNVLPLSKHASGQTLPSTITRVCYGLHLVRNLLRSVAVGNIRPQLGQSKTKVKQ